VKYLIINPLGVLKHLSEFTEVEADGPLMAATKILSAGDTGGIRLGLPGRDVGKVWNIEVGEEHDWVGVAVLVEVVTQKMVSQSLLAQSLHMGLIDREIFNAKMTELDVNGETDIDEVPEIT
jgi:hypothetical protein